PHSFPTRRSSDLGAEGMMAVSGDTVLRARLPAPLAGNPTGAGDAAVAAVATLLDAGEQDTAALLRRATAWSAAAVLMPLAGEISPRHPELEAALVVTEPETAESDHAEAPKDTQ